VGKSGGCLVIVGIPFAAVGIYAGVAAVRIFQIGGPTRMAFVFGCAAFAFGFAGFGIIAAAFRNGRNEKRDEELRARNPEQPWMWNAEWVDRRVRDQSRAGTAVLWGFALLWNAIASPVLVFVPAELAKGNRIAAIGFLFPLAGLLLILSAARLTLRALRFRPSTLTLETMPAPIGGALRGSVAVPHPLSHVTAILVRLVGMSRERSGKSTIDRILTHEERELEPSMLRQTPDGVVIPIEIAVPADAEPTSTAAGARQMFWRLSVDAEVPGIDYSATFDVPVFRTAFSDFRPHGIQQPAGPPRDPKNYVERDGPEGRELYFRPFRSPSLAFSSLGFSIVWIAAIVFMVSIDVPRFIPIICGLIAIPIVMSVLDRFFEVRTIVLAPDSIVIRRRTLGPSRTTIPHADVAGVNAVLVSGANTSRPYYHVDVRTHAGKRIRAATYIRSKREAEWVAGRIARW
jgi:hypothetical protein